jgi:trans-2,3-dihydro-3-hydroxyanthranilate isomerase
MEFVHVDVFADAPYRGNQLAVFPEAVDLGSRQMQSIAAEMNLSECVFVTEISNDSYSVRIFTPTEELGFAGHPTLGAAWVLKERGDLKGDTVSQRSPAGETKVSFRGEVVSLLRGGTVGPDLRGTDPTIDQKISRALGLEASDIGLEPRELGRSVNRLEVAVTDVGIVHLMVPLKDADVLARSTPLSDLILGLSPESAGLYCFSAVRAGAVRARAFLPPIGIAEDPATGAAAVGLGVYLQDRVGEIDLEIEQGFEMGRPSRLHLRARKEHVEVGGRCELVLKGELVTLP